MASTKPRGLSHQQNAENALQNQRRNPLSIDTSNAGALANARGHRFSFAGTPIEMNNPQIANPHRYEPDTRTIQDAPASASFHSPGFEPYAYGIGIAQDELQPHEEEMDNSQYPAEKPSGTSSPYGIPEPTQIHPAYFAPIDQSAVSPQFEHEQQQRAQQHNSSQPRSEQHPSADRTSTLKSEADEINEQVIQTPLHPSAITSSTSPRAIQQPIFSPGSLAGPNGVNPELHQPGQVLHPNMTFPSTTGGKGEWNHGMCECSGDCGTCITGIFCPCMIDSRTAYRLNRKSAKKDSTDMLGFSYCNTRCTIMGIFGLCGLCCFLPLTLRTRIRHTYKLQGNIGSDILHSCCCCCCTAIQNEREVAEREDLLRVNAGPAQTQSQYRSGGVSGMVYAR